MGHAPAGHVTALPDLEVLSARQAADATQLPGVRQQEWFDTEGRLAAFGGGTTTAWWMHWPHLGTFHFSSTGPVLAHPEPGADPADLHDTFTRHVLPFVLIGREHEGLHASAVGLDDGVTAFCAVSGTGKSSLALGLARRGAVQWADDTVVVRAEDRDVFAIALPFPPRVDRAVLEALTTDRLRNPDRMDDRRETAAESPHGVQVTPGALSRLRRVYFVSRDARLDPGKPSIRPLDGPPGFERLLAHAHPFDLPGPDRRRRMIERLLRVARTVPTYDLRFAPDLTSLPRLIDEVGRHLAFS